MRQRLQVFFPIFLIALMVQILAPIGAVWAAASAASDPLRGIEICHSPRDSQTTDPADDGQQGKPGWGSCTLCCAAQPAALDGPDLSVVAVVEREASDIVWRANSPCSGVARAGSNAQARAPPVA